MSYATAVLADSPVGFWRLIESSGTTAVDSSPNGRNGVYGSSMVIGQDARLIGLGGGKADSLCVSFPGNSNGVVTLPTSVGDFEYNQPFTVECWFADIGFLTTNLGIISKGSSSNAWSMYAYQGHFSFLMNNGTSNYTNSSPNATYSAGAWVHLVMVWDGSGSFVNGASWYVNGKVLLGTGYGTVSSGTVKNSSNALLGNSTSYYANNIRLNDMAVYSGALSQARITEHYLSAAPLYAAANPQASSVPVHHSASRPMKNIISTATGTGGTMKNLKRTRTNPRTN
jgi:hypothetical protein